MRRRIFGNDHPAVATSLNNLSTVLQKQDKYAEAEPIVREVVDIRRRLLGPDHPSTATSLNVTGRCSASPCGVQPSTEEPLPL